MHEAMKIVTQETFSEMRKFNDEVEAILVRLIFFFISLQIAQGDFYRVLKSKTDDANEIRRIHMHLWRQQIFLYFNAVKEMMIIFFLLLLIVYYQIQEMFREETIY